MLNPEFIIFAVIERAGSAGYISVGAETGYVRCCERAVYAPVKVGVVLDFERDFTAG
jgi:ribosomal protein S28E/S33